MNIPTCKQTGKFFINTTINSYNKKPATFSGSRLSMNAYYITSCEKEIIKNFEQTKLNTNIKYVQ